MNPTPLGQAAGLKPLLLSHRHLDVAGLLAIDPAQAVDDLLIGSQRLVEYPVGIQHRIGAPLVALVDEPQGIQLGHLTKLELVMGVIEGFHAGDRQ